MYAIFRTGSKQYKAAKGDTVELDRQHSKEGGLIEEGGPIEFPEVVFYNDGEKSHIGTPTVNGVKVVGEVVKNFRGEKIRVFKYQRREMYRRTRGHRSDLTLVKITDIISG